MTNQGEGSVFTRRKRVHFQPPLTVGAERHQEHRRG